MQPKREERPLIAHNSAQALALPLDRLAHLIDAIQKGGAFLRTDINGDTAANAVDVQLVINAALGLDIGDEYADIDFSGSVNAVDVQLVINAALGLL